VRDPANNPVKAWSRDYDEKPFFFGQNFPSGSRLIAWAGEIDANRDVLLKIIESMPSSLSVMVKISAERSENGKQTWTIYQGNPNKQTVLGAIRGSEEYVLADGMHQLWIKDVQTGKYLVFEEHGVFNLYFPNADDENIFLSSGFEKRFANPIFSTPHFHRTENNTEQAEMKFVANLGLVLTKPNSD